MFISQRGRLILKILAKYGGRLNFHKLRAKIEAKGGICSTKALTIEIGYLVQEKQVDYDQSSKLLWRI